jgi:hypothetical protein
MLFLTHYTPYAMTLRLTSARSERPQLGHRVVDTALSMLPFTLSKMNSVNSTALFSLTDITALWFTTHACTRRAYKWLGNARRLGLRHHASSRAWHVVCLLRQRNDAPRCARWRCRVFRAPAARPEGLRHRADRRQRVGGRKPPQRRHCVPVRDLQLRRGR